MVSVLGCIIELEIHEEQKQQGDDDFCDFHGANGESLRDKEVSSIIAREKKSFASEFFE